MEQNETAQPGFLHSMSEFWLVIKPILEAQRPGTVVEIGVEAGQFSENLMEFCTQNDALYVGIDPNLAPGLVGKIELAGHIVIPAFSCDGLRSIPIPDMCFVDGDHNYATVSDELHILMDTKDSNCSIIILHDVGWPCGRRDMYYLPTSLAENQRKNSRMHGGVAPWSHGIVPSAFRIDDGAFACEAGGPENGVLTAIENKLKGRSDWQFVKIPGIFGLGIVFRPGGCRPEALEYLAVIGNGLKVFGGLLQKLESNRVANFCATLNLHSQVEKAKICQVLELDPLKFRFPKNRMGLEFGKKKVSNLGRIIDRAGDNRIISFDCFDTLLHRDVLSPDVITMEACRFAATHLGKAGIDCSPENLFKLRLRAVQDVRSYQQSLGNDPEVRLFEIWDKTLKILCGFPWPEMAAFFSDVEVQTEIGHVRTAPGALETLRELKGQGKTVIILSDTIYDEKQLTTILSAHGLMVYIDQVFSSSQLRLGKYSSRLFGHVVDIMHFDRNSIVHIGANPTGDFSAPKALGIKAYRLFSLKEKISSWVGYRKKWRKEKKYLASGILTKRVLVNESVPSGEPYEQTLFNIGFSKFGPVFHSFVDQIVLDLQKREIRKVYFMARDGYVLKQIFDQIVKSRQLTYESHYLYISRASSTILDPQDLLREQYSNPGFRRDENTLRDLLSLCGVETVPSIPDPGEFGMNWHTRVGKVKGTDSYKKWVTKFAESEGVIRAHKEKKQLLLEYLAAEGVFPNNQQIAFVDIGWHGTIQRSIGDLLRRVEGAPSMRGYYLGRSGPQGTEVFDKKNQILPGFVFDSAGHNGLPVPPRGIFGVMEIAAGAPHGTTLGYKRADNTVIPELGISHPNEARAESLRRGAIEYAVSYEKFTGKKVAPGMSAIGARENFLSWFRNPSRNDVVAFAKIHFDLGWYKTDIFNIVAANLGLGRYLRRAIQNRLHVDTWKAGAMRFYGIPRSVVSLWQLSLKFRFLLK